MSIAMKKSLKAPILTENAEKVLQARYLKKNEKGEVIESPKELFWRVASHIASVEKEYGCSPETIQKSAELFYNIMAEGLFMPNSPTLMNAGREMGMLSACFVLPLEDSIEDIFGTIKATAMIQKAGGGTGFSFDKLRPSGDYISTSGGTTSGPISFWKVLSEATNAIQQGAFRRGANMGMMTITHPDIIKFIHAKQNLQAFTNFNISVKIPNAWMEQYVENPGKPHVVINARNNNQYVLPVDLDVMNYEIQNLIAVDEYEAMADKPKVWTNEEIFERITTNAWKTGEPGLIFIDQINACNPTPHIGEIESTNPCGEQPLLPWEACNLGSVNLAKFVRGEGQKATFDWDGYKEAIHASVRFLDNVIEANRYPLPEIEAMCKGNRKIGLGVMGFADALFMLGIPYNSEKGLEFGSQTMQVMNDESHNASEDLANERGSFSNWEGSTWQTKHNRPMRNATTTTVAPTGTISIIANCSGGVEPLFSLAFFRNVLNGQRLAEVNQVFANKAKALDLYSDEMIERIAEEGTVQHIEQLPSDMREVFVTSHDITPDWHVRMQAAFQQHCDSSISKTINMAHNAPIEDVAKIYKMAWGLKCKGVTIYRDGCRDLQPMALSKSNAKKEDSKEAPKAAPIKRTPEMFTPRRPMKTPTILSAVRIRQATPFGHMHVTISIDPKFKREMEVFAQLGKAGDVAMSDLEAISRLISLYLRIGGTLEQIVDQLEGIGSHMSIPTKDGRVMSLADGLGKTLRRFVQARNEFGLSAILMGDVDFDKLNLTVDSAIPTDSNVPHKNISAASRQAETIQSAFKIKCPECEANLVFEEGCVKCHGCGYSHC